MKLFWPLVLLTACTNKQDDVEQYSIEKCLLLDECSLLESFNHSSVQNCEEYEQTRANAGIYQEELALDCIEGLSTMYCYEFIHYGQPQSCNDWIEPQNSSVD